MELVDGAGNDCEIVDNRGGSGPNCNGRNMTKNGSVRQETSTSGKHWGQGSIMSRALFGDRFAAYYNDDRIDVGEHASGYGRP